MNRVLGRWIVMGGMMCFAFPGLVPAVRGEDLVSKERTVRVEGQGKALAVPDQARLEFEVQAEAVKLEDASAQAKIRMSDLLRSIKALGIPEKDIQTVRFNIQPKYKYDKEGNENKQVGFLVSNRLRVVLRDLDLAGKTLEAVTRAGVSQVDGPFFGFSDPSKLEILALKDAMEDARGKAEALAQAAGTSLGKVQTVSQTSLGSPSPRPMVSMLMKAGGDVPVERGEDEVTAQVEVVYSLK